jgi:hypothetical protein
MSFISLLLKRKAAKFCEISSSSNRFYNAVVALIETNQPSAYIAAVVNARRLVNMTSAVCGAYAAFLKGKDQDGYLAATTAMFALRQFQCPANDAAAQLAAVISMPSPRKILLNPSPDLPSLPSVAAKKDDMRTLLLLAAYGFKFEGEATHKYGPENVMPYRIDRAFDEAVYGGTFHPRNLYEEPKLPGCPQGSPWFRSNSNIRLRM